MKAQIRNELIAALARRAEADEQIATARAMLRLLAAQDSAAAKAKADQAKAEAAVAFEKDIAARKAADLAAYEDDGGIVNAM